MNGEYLARRFGQSVMTFVIVVTITFTMAKLLPGGAWVIQCLTGAQGTGQCQPPPGYEASAGVPAGELAVMTAFIALLLVLSAVIIRE